jgi:SNF2 family DNA or RNA helicase
VRLTGLSVTPAEVIAAWKSDFARFWPQGNRFDGPLTGVAPG